MRWAALQPTPHSPLSSTNRYILPIVADQHDLVTPESKSLIDTAKHPGLIGAPPRNIVGQLEKED